MKKWSLVIYTNEQPRLQNNALGVNAWQAINDYLAFWQDGRELSELRYNSSTKQYNGVLTTGDHVNIQEQ